MKYRHIVSVTGLGGLYQLISTKANGAFVKSLDDLSNKFISSRTHQVTPLESIEIYTVGDNIHLHEVFEKLKNIDGEIEAADFKNNNTIQEIFTKAVPEYDSERVYVSDIRKMLKWYLLLKKNELLDFSEYKEQAGSEEESVVTEEPEAEKVEEAVKPAKKAKTTTKKAKKEAVAAKEDEQPIAEKKTTTKKTATKKAAPKKAKDAE